MSTAKISVAKKAINHIEKKLSKDMVLGIGTVQLLISLLMNYQILKIILKVRYQAQRHQQFF